MVSQAAKLEAVPGVDRSESKKGRKDVEHARRTESRGDRSGSKRAGKGATQVEWQDGIGTGRFESGEMIRNEMVFEKRGKMWQEFYVEKQFLLENL